MKYVFVRHFFMMCMSVDVDVRKYETNVCVCIMGTKPSSISMIHVYI